MEEGYSFMMGHCCELISLEGADLATGRLGLSCDGRRRSV